MADTSTIEWTDATWNPITGCTMVSAGCTNCYAMGLAATRLRHHPSRAGLTRMTGGRAVWTGEVRLNEQWLDQPLRWTRPRRIFVCAHGDLFHEAVPYVWIDRVFAVMALAPQHTFQVLTKRPERMRAYFSYDEGFGRWGFIEHHARQMIHRRGQPQPKGKTLAHHGCSNFPHVWLGTSIEDQATADARIPHLLAAPAAVRFLSAEPLLGPVDLTRIPQEGNSLKPDALRGRCITWVIVGGESGRDARPMHPDWARVLRDQCQEAGVAFFFKQWGEWAPGEMSGPNARSIDAAVWWDDRWDYERVGPARSDYHRDDEPDLFRIGKKAAGRLLDGRTWDEMPGRRHA